MKKQPKIGTHTITYRDGKSEEILVLGHIKGNTSAVVFKKTGQSTRAHVQVLQYHDDVHSWGVMVMHNPLKLRPVTVSWE